MATTKIKLTAEQKAAVKKGGKVELPVNGIVDSPAKKPAVKRPSPVSANHGAFGKIKMKKAVAAANPVNALKPEVSIKPKKVKSEVLKYKGAVIPVGRKQGDDEDNVPTIVVKTVSDTMKLFEKLPKGCTWGAAGNGQAGGCLNIYNAKGMLICELRTAK